ncbi:conserved hypothetical protein [Gluconacetobacter diazotrophicus PA1 5]|uniref:Transmembrane protein n=2 Tax=Gluconacetobacter diazotrophicus TaxID=33996 RepID=A0A7W4I3U6_GLUDI|nr:hypothetical protein [Gluconacetobacter diazotrophicus]ACI51140.1 conserved hypothetical protein [Gluconacetobacter diazotrophicus PA1 5]MBB2155146.1 hypothetical protein [Gluconacetobacter diazotrophicus]TWB07585.1 hypothetical protein FBZ86_11131 [Gluconacetobacter diazotrophicus]
MYHPFAFMRLPYSVLTALDSRMYHYWMQPVHYLVRIVHILSMSGFFGIEMIFDFALFRRNGQATLGAVSRLIMPWVHWMFGVAMVSGVALFFYDPVRIGSRGYLSPKLLLIALALGLVALVHRRIYQPSMGGRPAGLPRSRVVAVASLLLWTGVIVLSCLNSEGVPKVFLR